jgi:putative tryptophan/tyrosine transport system substrate-binding protein
MLAMKATTKQTVLFAMSGDPVELGIAESLARPGRNFTGFTFMSVELAQKRVDLLHELLPNMQSLAVLSNTGHPGERSEHDATAQAADALGIKLLYVPFASADELESALERVFFLRPGAMLVFPDGVTLVNRLRIAQFAKNHGLVSYGASQRATYRHLASYADRLLHGESPATLPIERPTSFELVINLKTAGLLGLKVPTALLVRANDLIE